MKPKLFGVLMILVFLLQNVVPGASADPGPLPAGSFSGDPLQPGALVTYEQEVPINIVFIGYDQTMINTDTIMGRLPATYTPVVRAPRTYDLQGRDLGLKYTFNYNMTFADPNLVTHFFNYLKDIGKPGDPTIFQTSYNDQEKNVLDVTGPVLYIEGTCVEKWLAKRLVKGPGYTIVFINWYSQPDFQFHLYTKTDEPDPDTGISLGVKYQSRKMIAWGGGSSRLWFYDLSAGPESWTDNWNVDTPDLNGDGKEEYRMPPIWEYAVGGYRDPSRLSYDLGMITRCVGIDMLFTSSPLYDPLVTAPGLGGSKILHISMLEDDPASSGTDWIKGDIVQDAFTRLEPYYQWQSQVMDVNPIDPGAQRAFRIYTGIINEPDCWNWFEDNLAQLFCYFNAYRPMYIPEYGENDYVAGLYAYNTTTENMGDQDTQTGYAYDNWVDGTQTYSFSFNTAFYREELGIGFSNSAVHELGHHFGFSHPHDGYDSEKGVNIGAKANFYFLWSGDESDSIMHYLFLSQHFSRFERDNLYRWEMAGYLNWSNQLLDDIQAHPEAAREQENIATAEKYARRAIKNFNDWKFLCAATNARTAYEIVAKSAEELGVVDTTREMLNATQGQQPIIIEREVDIFRYPE